MFYLAHEICRIMNFTNSDQLFQRIFVKWAKLRIESGQLGPDPKSANEKIISDISERLQASYKSLGRSYNVNFSKIAQFAAKVKGKTQLAKDIMDTLEQSIEIKVYFLLWLRDYEKALKDALMTKDSNIINCVLHNMIQSINFTKDENDEISGDEEGPENP